MKKGNLRGEPQSLFPLFEENDTFSFEQELARQGYTSIAGVDEVGRGPLAGPVVAASVILPGSCDYSVYDDSKKLTAKKRESLYEELKNIGAAIGIGVIPESKIDRINILQASLLAMKKSLEGLALRPDFLLVDGKYPVPIAIAQQALVKGDSRSASIAAASIVAKVTRDAMMVSYHQQYPQYNFQKNKGYPTAEHRKALAANGPCPIHRKSFAGVKEFFEKQGAPEQD